jgi:hypothetical protein
MSLKRPATGPVMAKSELAIFSEIPTQIQVEESHVDIIKCINLSIDDFRVPLEFQVKYLFPNPL